MPMSDVTDCLRDWLFEMFDCALARQPSVALAHARFKMQLETAHNEVAASLAIATRLQEQAGNVRCQVNVRKLKARKSVQAGETAHARLSVRSFFEQLRLASILDAECAAARKRILRMQLLLAKLDAIEQRLYFLTLFLAPLPAFVESERDDHLLMLQSLWQFISGDPADDGGSRTKMLVEKIEALELNALGEYAHIDRKHAARLRTSVRHKLEKRIEVHKDQLQEELDKQTIRMLKLARKEKEELAEENRFQHRLTVVRQKHCEKLILRLEVFILILEKTEKALKTSLQNAARGAS